MNDAGDEPTGDEDELVNEADLRSWAMLLHFSPLAVSFFGPIIIWLLKKDELPQLEMHFKKAMNFLIVQLIFFVSGLILTVISCGFLVPLPIAAMLMMMICPIIAGINANNGKEVSYPLVFFKAFK